MPASQVERLQPPWKQSEPPSPESLLRFDCRRDSASYSGSSANGQLPAMSRNGALIGAANQPVEPGRRKNHSYRRGAHGGSAPIALGRDVGRVAELQKAPHGNAGMNGFLTLQEFLPNRFMACVAFAQNSSRHRDGLFRIVGGLTDTPLIPLAKVA